MTKSNFGLDNAQPASSLKLGRRDLLQAGLAGAATVLTAGAASGEVAAAPQTTPHTGKRTPQYRIIDTHNHPNWVGYNGARIVEDMDNAGIERTWLLSWELPEVEMAVNYYRELTPTGVGIPFRDVIDVAQRYPDRFILGTTTDPRDPHAHQKLKAAVDIFHVRVFGEFKRRIRYDNPDVIRLFHYAGELGLPVTIHLDATFPRHGVASDWQWWYGGGLETMEAALRLCPHTHFQGHGPAFWREISGDADQASPGYPKGPIVGRGLMLDYLEKYPNLNLDLSANSAHGALSRDMEFSRRFLTDYQDRAFFARDAYNNNMYDLLVSLNLPPEVMAKILSGNALRLVPV